MSGEPTKDCLVDNSVNGEEGEPKPGPSAAEKAPVKICDVEGVKKEVEQEDRGKEVAAKVEGGMQETKGSQANEPARRRPRGIALMHTGCNRMYDYPGMMEMQRERTKQRNRDRAKRLRMAQERENGDN